MGSHTIGPAIGMARCALLADPTFRESWETHRWGFLEEPLLTSKIFPAGIILDSLLKHGHRDPQALERLFQKWRKNNYHYYDEPCSLPPDSDLTGLMFRLHRYRASAPDPAVAYRVPLKRLEVNRLPSGEIPVFLMHPVKNGGRIYSEMADNHCATCLTNLLIGLWGFNGTVEATLVESATSFLFETLLKKRRFPSQCYSYLTELWRLTELALLVRAQGSTSMQEIAEQILLILKKRFRDYDSKINTPQQTAKAILISLQAGIESLFKKEWVEVLIGQQRYDGLWEAEAFYVVPGIGGSLSWHSSRLITTAICYDALMTYLVWKYK